MYSADDSREAFQLMTIALFYLDLAEHTLAQLPLNNRIISISKNTEKARGLHALQPPSTLDIFFAHAGSAAVRLVTAREFYDPQARKHAYRNLRLPLTESQIQKAKKEDLEVLLRDNIGHREAGTHPKARKRNAVLDDLTPSDVLSLLKDRFDEIKRQLNSRGVIALTPNGSQG